MRTKQVFVLVENYFEYNDEIYHQGNHGNSGGMPEKVFLTKEKAEEKIAVLSLKRIRENFGSELGNFAYDIGDVLNHKNRKRVAQILKTEDLDDWFRDDCGTIKNLSDAEAIELINLLDIKLYQVAPAELEIE